MLMDGSQASMMRVDAPPRSDNLMTQRLNALGQPIGDPLPGWTPPPPQRRRPLAGRYCHLEPLDVAAHAMRLFAADAEDRDGRSWTYLAYGPFDRLADYQAWMA